MRLLCQCRVRTGRGLLRQHCDESHHQGGQASDQVCTRTPNRRRRQHRTSRLEDTQVSGIVGHDAAADTSLAPLPGRARHTHSGIEGCWHRLGSLWALRVSGRSEGLEQCPVGFAGVEQGSDSVVVEVDESEGGAFDAFDEVVGCFGGGGLVTRAACQLEIWVRQFQMVRPSRLISSGMLGSWRSVASWATVAAPTLAQGIS